MASGSNLKQSPIPVVSRTVKIVNPDGTVTRSGQLMLEQLQASTTVSGTHDERPAPGDTTEGAIYVESDRGVIYQNRDGTWVYIAGTMYGTLIPDQRPIDLGAADGGFQFRANDVDIADRGREFVWSGTAWVEITQVRYGTHDERPAPEDAPARCLYVEWDRGSVVYQNQDSVWQYIGGTMYGTLDPDQRPDDLDMPDAGFIFATNVDPSQKFAWSGTAWIETTPIRYGTHAARLAAPIADLVSGMLWMETDRDNVVYQVQTVAGSPAWVYVAGTMNDAFAALPPGLGTNDVNFTFATSDTLEVYRWAGAAWVNQTPANTVQLAQGAGTTILTTVFQDVAGLSLALPRPGRYMAVGVVDFSIGTGDAGANMLAQLILPSGAPAAQLIVFGAPILGLRSTVSQQWIFTANAGQTINIQARKNSGTGASSVTSHCSLSAIWLGP